MDFIIEIDKLKTVLRQAYICDTSLRENSALNSWYVAMMAMVLPGYSTRKIDFLPHFQGATLDGYYPDHPLGHTPVLVYRLV
jgi:hypothetical protein